MGKSHMSSSGSDGAGSGVAGGLAAGAGAGLVSGAGGTTLHTCRPDDESTYCRMSRAVGIVKMIIFFIVLIVVLVVLFYLFKDWRASRKAGGRKVGKK